MVNEYDDGACGECAGKCSWLDGLFRISYKNRPITLYDDVAPNF